MGIGKLDLSTCGLTHSVRDGVFVMGVANPHESKVVFDMNCQHVFHSWISQGALNPL